jgi:transposase
MPLSQEERVEIVMLSRQEGWSYRSIAEEFNSRHPERPPVTFSGVAQLIRRFKETGSVTDRPRPGRPSATDTETREAVLAEAMVNPTTSVRRRALELGLNRETLRRMLKNEAFHPYKLQVLQSLTEGDPQKRLEMCEWFADRLSTNTRFTEDCVLFSDEALFFVNGEVNVQNTRYWSQNNPHWMTPLRQQGAQKLMVWCGLWKAHVLGPFFFDQTMTGEAYLTMLGDQLMPQLDGLGEGLPEWFQHDGAAPHYSRAVRHWLDANLPNWIGRCGPLEWAPRSPDLTPLDFFFWGVIKEKVYSAKIRNLEHLKARIVSACAEINGNVEMLHRVHENLAKRIHLCMLNDGGHIEHILN